MTDELKVLISRADTGSREAQHELIQRGDTASEAGDHQQAAYLYKMAAMASRIAAGRNNSLAVEALGKQAYLQRVLYLYEDWSAAYTKPDEPRINMLRKMECTFSDDMTPERAIMTLRRSEGKWRFMVRYLEDQLTEHDVELCTGNTINRHFVRMVRRADYLGDMIDKVCFRVVLDPICDEVLRMCTEVRTTNNDNQ
jgi:hypothetical protein